MTCVFPTLCILCSHRTLLVFPSVPLSYHAALSKVCPSVFLVICICLFINDIVSVVWPYLSLAVCVHLVYTTECVSDCVRARLLLDTISSDAAAESCLSIEVFGLVSNCGHLNVQ